MNFITYQKDMYTKLTNIVNLQSLKLQRGQMAPASIEAFGHASTVYRLMNQWKREAVEPHYPMIRDYIANLITLQFQFLLHHNLANSHKPKRSFFFYQIMNSNQEWNFVIPSCCSLECQYQHLYTYPGYVNIFAANDITPNCSQYTCWAPRKEKQLWRTVHQAISWTCKSQTYVHILVMVS